jgi:uncharacterized repeat protein (TIGR03803 family)
METTMRRISILMLERSFVVLLICAATAIAPRAQVVTTVFSFDGANGYNPAAMLVQGIDGNFYGTTENGGADNYGTVFEITTAGTLTTLHNFVGFPNEGSSPHGALVLTSDGDLIGTTVTGGFNNYGTVYKITVDGRLTTLYSFCDYPCTDGALPYAGLMQATNGNFYGVTTNGGNPVVGAGTVFEMTPAGKLKTVHAFNVDDGAEPQYPLIQATDGNLAGTTVSGGSARSGTGFKMTLAGDLTTLYNFCGVENCTDGVGPSGPPYWPLTGSSTVQPNRAASTATAAARSTNSRQARTN